MTEVLANRHAYHFNKQTNKQTNSVISGFRREVAENCPRLGCYAASSGKFLNPEDETDRLSRNVRKELSHTLRSNVEQCRSEASKLDCTEEGSVTAADSFSASQQIPHMILLPLLLSHMNPVDAHVSSFLRSIFIAVRFQVVSLPQVSPPTPSMYCFSHPHLPHAQSISSTLF